MDVVLELGLMEVKKDLHLKGRALARVAAVPASLPNIRHSFANSGKRK